MEGLPIFFHPGLKLFFVSFGERSGLKSCANLSWYEVHSWAGAPRVTMIGALTGGNSLVHDALINIPHPVGVEIAHVLTEVLTFVKKLSRFVLVQGTRAFADDAASVPFYGSIVLLPAVFESMFPRLIIPSRYSH